mgnify:CR=1 FL=1
MRMIIAALALLAAVPQAQADDCADRGMRTQAVRSCDVFGCSIRYRCVRRAATRVYGYERREEDDRWREQGRRRDQCLDVEVDVLSTEHHSEDNARESARKLWMSKVQWQHGSRHMDLDAAAAVRWQCGPSNAHDTMSGKLAETVGTLTGKGGQNVRCALWARPCSTERTPGDGKGRR